MNPSLFTAGGALTDEHMGVYIERQADYEILTHLHLMNYLLVIEPRQQGKTSLINHLMRHPSLSAVNFVCVDVSTPDRSSEAMWYQMLCPRILRQLKGLIAKNQWPSIPRDSAGWREFLWNISVAATKSDKYVVIALDEIGAVTFPWAAQFFSVLREVYGSRQAETEFKQLTFLLAGAFHPRNLIENDRISPFNIAQRVRLRDFTIEQIRSLIEKGNWSDKQVATLGKSIHYWTDGQPYLTQLFCSLLDSNTVSNKDVNRIVEWLRREDENHLPPLLKQLDRDKRLCNYIKRILLGEGIKFYPKEHPRQAQLELLGLIKADKKGYCTIRNHFYKQVLIDYCQTEDSNNKDIDFNDLCMERSPDSKTQSISDEHESNVKNDSTPINSESLYGSGNRWAVLIGVNEYKDQIHYGQLKVCVKDVDAIYTQLVTSGFDKQRIHLFSDHTDQIPTRDNMLVALKAVADATEKDDLLLFYYSGHGDKEGSESYLVTQNGRHVALEDTAVKISRVKQIMQQAQARAKVIVLDACHSGANIEGKGAKSMSEEFIQRVFKQAEGIAILASCKQGQVSYEWRENERSVFTHYLLEALQGDADREGKGFVTVQDANRHVTNEVKLWASERKFSQTPTLQYTVTGDIILVTYKQV